MEPTHARVTVELDVTTNGSAYDVHDRVACLQFSESFEAALKRHGASDCAPMMVRSDVWECGFALVWTVVSYRWAVYNVPRDSVSSVREALRDVCGVINAPLAHGHILCDPDTATITPTPA